MATQKVFASYQEVIDLHTESDRVTVLGIHTPTGSFPRQMFKGFFDQFKKYKYLGCSISLVPAARLPADPSMISYEGGEAVLDARDLMNPLMFHGCHGDDLGTILNQLYGDDAGVSDSIVGIDVGGNTPIGTYEAFERLYYKALTDKSWKKAHPMKGFRKSGLRPLVYSMATNRQLMPGSVSTILGDNASLGFDSAGNFRNPLGDPSSDFDINEEESAITVHPNTKRNLQFFTPKLTGLGWIDTRNVLTKGREYEDDGTLDEQLIYDINNAFEVNYAELPKIFMGCILLPPAYKTEQYYRMIVNHSFAFKQFRGISFQPDVTTVPTYWNKNGDGTEEYDVIGDMAQGHFGPQEGFTPEGGGSDPEPEPTITVTALSLQVVNENSVDTSDAIRFWIKYPGTANFVPFHDFAVVRAGSTALWQTVNVPVGSILGNSYIGSTIPSRQFAVVDRSQSNNVYRLTYSSSGQWIGEYPVSLNESRLVDPDYKKVVFDEL